MTKKPSTFERDLAAIQAIAAGEGARPLETLRAVLDRGSGYLVAEAARAVTTRSLDALHVDLARAFQRLAAAGAKEDSGCVGKQAALTALGEAEAWFPAEYLAGARLVQRERSGPTLVDTAAQVRVLAAQALFRSAHPDAVFVATELLADPEAVTRAESARLLGHFAPSSAETLLRLKLLVGDGEVEVMGACALALLTANADRSAPFVYARLSASEGAVADAFALAIAEARPPGALDALLAREERLKSHDDATVLYLAMSLLRSREALDHLISRLSVAPEARALLALEALAVHRHDARVSREVAAIASRRSKALQAAWRERFEP
jgi:hypothetical protein